MLAKSLDVQVGDKVYAREKFGRDYYIQTVKKITPKGFIRLENGDLLNEYGWKKTTNAWGTTWYQKVTPELLVEIKNNRRIKKARSAVIEKMIEARNRIKSIDINTLEEINELLGKALEK